MQNWPKVQLISNWNRFNGHCSKLLVWHLRYIVIRFPYWHLFEHCISILMMLIGTHLASRTSYLVIICPSPHEMLIKFKLQCRLSRIRFEYFLKSQEILNQKLNLTGQIGICCNISQSHSNMKSYLIIIICLNSHDKLTKIRIRPNWFKRLTKSLTQPFLIVIW